MLDTTPVTREITRLSTGLGEIIQDSCFAPIW